MESTVFGKITTVLKTCVLIPQMQSYGTVPNVTSDFFLQGLVGPQGLKGNQVTYCLQCLAYYKNKVTNVIVADHLCTHTCVISFIK